MCNESFASRGWTALVAVAAFGATACGGSDGSGSSNVTTTTTDSAGVAIISNAGAGWDAADAWRLEPMVTIGEMEGEVAFANIGSISIAPDGRMYVLDLQEQEVFIFDADGNLIRKIGGQGGGPGEFTRATVVQAVGNDVVAVGEAFPPKLHRLDTEGELIETQTLEGPSDIAFIGDWKITPEGEARILIRAFDVQSEGGASSFIATVNADGKMADTVASWVRPWKQNSPVMFQPAWVWALGPGPAITASPGRAYEIRTYGAAPEMETATEDGGWLTERIVRLETEPVVVTEEVKQAAIERIREFATAQGAPDNLIDDILERMTFEEYFPAIASVWVSDPGGFLWVGIPSPSAQAINFTGGFSGGELSGFDVFTPDGTYLGRIPAPENFQPMIVRDDAMYGSWTDEFDVPYVRSYQIVQGSEVVGMAP
jgi:hypothetical protein